MSSVARPHKVLAQPILEFFITSSLPDAQLETYNVSLAAFRREMGGV